MKTTELNSRRKTIQCWKTRYWTYNSLRNTINRERATQQTHDLVVVIIRSAILYTNSLIPDSAVGNRSKLPTAAAN